MMAPMIFIVAGAAALIATFCLRRAWGKAVGFLITLGLMAALWQASLGRPRPAIMPPPMGVVTGFMLDEPHAIYLWIVPNGRRVPVAYRLPWNEKQAAELMRAARRARKRGTALMIEAYRAGGRDKMKFYSTDTTPLPPKEAG